MGLAGEVQEVLAGAVDLAEEVQAVLAGAVLAAEVRVEEVAAPPWAREEDPWAQAEDP